MTFKDMNFNGPSDFMKLVEGENPIRIVGEPKMVEGKFGSRPAMWVIDRKTGDMKILQFAKTIGEQIQQLQVSNDYGFEKLPDYDITIVRTGMGQFDTSYNVRAARQNTELTEDEKALVKKTMEEKGDVEQFFEKMAAKHLEQRVNEPSSQADIDEIFQ